MEERNVSLWTSMIVGYAMHDHVNDALDCFRYMRKSGVRPNNVTFVWACVHVSMAGQCKRENITST